MTRWVALLRAINLGARNKVPMAELRELLSGLGYEDVRTLLQSGNAVFAADATTAAKLETELEAALEDRFGFVVAVLVRDSAEWSAMVDANPFVSADAGPTELHATFLAEDPTDARLAALDPAAHAPDEFAFGDRVMYLRLPNGTAGSKLPAAEKLLDVTTTTRNWNTVRKIQTLLTTPAGG